MMTWIEDLKQTMREMPWFAAAFGLLVVLGIGVNAEILGAADGDEARVCVGRVDTPMLPTLGAGEWNVHRCVTGATPGLTVLVGIRHYRMEVTIPAAAVRSTLASVKMNLDCVAPVLHGVFGRVAGECKG
jgi:hypothetical protein